jgi:hypothetical protein
MIAKIFVLCIEDLFYSTHGTRFEARSCISEPCPQDPYRDIFWNETLLNYESSMISFDLNVSQFCD